MTIAAFRFNNPFDVSLPIAGYSGPGSVAGIQGQKGYASFPDMSTGYGAGVQRLNSYISGQSSHGPLTSINQLNTVYATDPNWAKGVARYSGIGADEKLDPTDPAQMSKLQYGVLAQEIGPDNAAQVVQNYASAPPQGSSQASSPSPENALASPASPANAPVAGLAPPTQAAPYFAVAQQSPSAPIQPFTPPPIQPVQIYYAPRKPIDLSGLQSFTPAPIFARG